MNIKEAQKQSIELGTDLFDLCTKKGCCMCRWLDVDLGIFEQLFTFTGKACKRLSTVEGIKDDADFWVENLRSLSHVRLHIAAKLTPQEWHLLELK